MAVGGGAGAERCSRMCCGWGSYESFFGPRGFGPSVGGMSRCFLC